MSFPLLPPHDALFLDIDGTLLDLAPTPEAVVVPPELPAQLEALRAKLGGALALLSGRPLAEIDALFAPLVLPASGAHGAECRLSGAVQAAGLLPERLRAKARALFSHPGLLVEDKGHALAVHYRQAPDQGEWVTQQLGVLVAEAEEPLTLLPGKMVCELVRPGQTKGTALAHFMTQPPFAGRRPLFLGDDETDRAAIAACRELGGKADHVGHAGAYFSTPSDVRAWIAQQAGA